MKRKKLSKSDIDERLQRIRSTYDEYMVRYIKNSNAREAFERRYRDALVSRIELDHFLNVELKVALEMCAKEKKRQRQAEADKILSDSEHERSLKGGENPEDALERRKDFADKYIDKMKQKAEKYPVAGLENSEVWEVDHLYGALQRFEREHWPPVDRVYRKIYPSRYDGPRITLENKLLELSEARMGGIPQVLHTLQMLMGRFPRNYREIEWEIKQNILRAAFFLHNARDEIHKLTHESYLENGERAAVRAALEYVEAVIEDFRLKDLKQK